MHSKACADEAHARELAVKMWNEHNPTGPRACIPPPQTTSVPQPAPAEQQNRLQAAMVQPPSSLQSGYKRPAPDNWASEGSPTRRKHLSLPALKPTATQQHKSQMQSEHRVATGRASLQLSAPPDQPRRVQQAVPVLQTAQPATTGPGQVCYLA